MATLPQNCDRARAWVSLKLDGELSELEGFMLESHLARCEACRAFAADAVGFTTALRTAPLEPLERPVSLPAGRRSMRRAVQFGAAAALVATSVGLGSLFGALGSGRAHAPSPPRLLQGEPTSSSPSRSRSTATRRGSRRRSRLRSAPCATRASPSRRATSRAGSPGASRSR